MEMTTLEPLVELVDKAMATTHMVQELQAELVARVMVMMITLEKALLVQETRTQQWVSLWKRLEEC